MKARLLKFPQNDVSGKVDNQSCLPLRLFYNLPYEAPNILWLCATYVSALIETGLLFIMNLNFIYQARHSRNLLSGFYGHSAQAGRLTATQYHNGANVIWQT
ncbi:MULTISPECIES: hypothetical protein [Pantoea]|jgi:hypothetical protein|uniref:hypothetical protein n=1 Tax=Pantoea TaxID=53335 RepID=UPI002580D374|nr:hypothetical protein [Pantoea sp. UBA5960]